MTTISATELYSAGPMNDAARAKKRQAVPATKRKRLAAKQTSVKQQDPLAAYHFGGLEIVGDIISPASDPKHWELD